MSEQIRSRNIARFVYTGNRYRVVVVGRKVHFEPIGEIIGNQAESMSWELLQEMIEDGVIEIEEGGND